MKSKTVMPKTLRIGPYKYTLKVDDAAILDYQSVGGEQVGAFTDPPHRSMTFASASSQPSTTLHEVLHVLCDQSGLNIRLGSEREEDVIQSIEHLLLGVIRDNPALIAYLTAPD